VRSGVDESINGIIGVRDRPPVGCGHLLGIERCLTLAEAADCRRRVREADCFAAAWHQEGRAAARQSESAWPSRESESAIPCALIRPDARARRGIGRTMSLP